METTALWVDPGSIFSCLRLYSAFAAAARVSICPLNPIKIYATARDFQIACIFSDLGENPLRSTGAKPHLIRVNCPIGLGHIPQRIEERHGPGRSSRPGVHSGPVGFIAFECKGSASDRVSNDNAGRAGWNLNRGSESCQYCRDL